MNFRTDADSVLSAEDTPLFWEHFLFLLSSSQCYTGIIINFSKKIKQSIQKIKIFPKAYEKTGYQIEGLDVFVKPCDTYLIFFVVDDAKIIVLRVLKDRMYWKSVIERMQN